MHVLISHLRWKTTSLEEENIGARVRGRKRMMVQLRRWRQEKMADYDDEEEDVKKPASKKWRPMG